MEQIGYQLVHSIAGRIRIRVAWLETDLDAANQYQRLLEALSYVNSVRINSLAQSIVILYNAKTLTIAEAEDRFVSVMQQVKLTPPMEVATIETEPAQTPPSTPEPVSQPIEEPVRETPSPTPKSPTPQTASAIPEIPSPWDEPEEISTTSRTAPDAIQSTSLEEASNPVERVDAGSVDQTLSTSLLAQRLRVTSQAITRRRTKTDFQTWTQAQDPEGIAWCYDPASRSFHPTPASAQTHKLTQAQEIPIKTTEIIDKTLGEEIGSVVGETVGEVVLGPAGAVVGEGIGAVVGEWVGEEIAHEQETLATAGEKIGKASGQAVGETLSGQEGAELGEAIGAEMGKTIAEAKDKTSEPDVTKPKSRKQKSTQTTTKQRSTRKKGK